MVYEKTATDRALLRAYYVTLAGCGIYSCYWLYTLVYPWHWNNDHHACAEKMCTIISVRSAVCELTENVRLARDLWDLACLMLFDLYCSQIIYISISCFLVGISQKLSACDCKYICLCQDTVQEHDVHRVKNYTFATCSLGLTVNLWYLHYMCNLICWIKFLDTAADEMCYF